jgi:hypothetical protein
MKITLGLVVAGVTCLSVASAKGVVVDFEKSWDYGTAVDGYYGGGQASDGSAGANIGVTFTNVLGLSNDAFFTYYLNAPSAQGVAFVQLDGTVNTASYMNVAGGVSGGLGFYYNSPSDVPSAIRAYSGPNGTGTLLGTFDLTANDPGTSTETGSGAGVVWTPVVFGFSGTALSFDLTGSANVVGFDNFNTSVPEPMGMGLVAGAAMGMVVGRRRR